MLCCVNFTKLNKAARQILMVKICANELVAKNCDRTHVSNKFTEYIKKSI